MRLPSSVPCCPAILAAWMFMLGSCAQAATRIADSLAQADVQKAVDAAVDGDTVQLPAGTATWTASVSVTGKFITIRGAGIDKTTIVGGDYAPSTTRPTHRVFEIAVKPGGLTRLTGLTIDGGTGAKDTYNKGMIAVAGDSTTWRVDHLRIRATRTSAMHVSASGGVIDHNSFLLVGWIFGIYGFNGGGSYGDAAWAEDTDLGAGDKAFFVEDNEFAATERSVALDGWKGQRIVVRHNTFRNATIGNHGTESSGRLRGSRSFEIYDNVIQYTGPNWPSAIGFRSGTGVVFNNRISGDFQEAMRVDNYRDWRAFAPWGIASGESPFDKNDVNDDGQPAVYDTGTHTGAPEAPVLVCAGKTWTDNQWRGYSVFNTTTGRSSIITSNSSDSLVARVDRSYGEVNLAWNPGDGFKIQRCLVALDQMGRGKGNPVTGTVPAPAAWPEQVEDPTYVWNNTLNGRVGRLVSSSPRIQDGVDFFNGTPKPGYTPYAYPHPLVSEQPAAGVNP
ncbi:MAG: hypothetical protein KJ000_19335 [Pirellulaceae bacterium]|nr:hypothetical protein [Pirellulaceae bacterium]